MRFTLVIAFVSIVSAGAHLQAAVGTPSALYLCTSCYTGGYGAQDDFFNTQLAMFQAESGKLISVGSDVPNEEMIKRARAAGMPVEKTRYGYTTLQKYRAGTPEDSKEAMSEGILAQLKKLDRSQPVTIHIADHGWNGNLSGTGTLPPEKSGIVLKTQTSSFQSEKELVLTHEEFAELLKKAGLVGEGAPQLRIIAEHCYGGGTHWISEKFPNVCTAAFTSNEEANYVSDNESQALWQHVESGKKSGRATSLSEGFYAGWSTKSNPHSEGGALGSTQYVRNILKKNGIDAKKLGEDTLTTWTDWSELKESNFSESSCRLPPPLTPLSFEQISSIQKVLAVIQPDQISKSKEYAEALAAIQKTGAADQKLLSEYTARFQEAQSAWKKLSLEEKAARSRDYTEDLGSFFEWMKGDFASSKKSKLDEVQSEKSRAEKSFFDYRKQNYPRIQAYLKNRELLARMGEFNKFSELVEQKKVSATELKTYQRMIACESLPL